MSGEQDKGGADAGQQDVPTVTVHDYDPVRPAPPKKPAKKPTKADGEDE